jgi:hypothetical protein
MRKKREAKRLRKFNEHLEAVARMDAARMAHLDNMQATADALSKEKREATAGARQFLNDRKATKNAAKKAWKAGWKGARK